MGMGMLLRLPHGFLRRHLSAFERVLVAAAFAFGLYQLMVALPVYPSPWEIVVAVAVFLVMMWSPPVAYFLAVIAAIYPLYTVSLYLAVLFLAVAMLGQRAFINNLGATLLVISAPWLAQFHLEWLPVLLGGLWWGKTNGAWIGGLAALWGQLLFGMTGTNPDWLSMMGTAPAVQEIAIRYGPANSLETLTLLVTPLAPNPTLLLYHLLQIVVWAMIAGLVGGLAESTWAMGKRPLRPIAGVLGGAALLLAGSLGLSAWLEQYRTEDFAWIIPGLFETALYAGLLAVFLEAGRDFIERPLAIGGRRLAYDYPRQPGSQQQPLISDQPPAVAQTFRSRLQGLFERARDLRIHGPASAQPGSVYPAGAPSAKAQRAEDAQAGATDYQPLPVPSNLPRRDPQKQRSDDIIKIELD